MPVLDQRKYRDLALGTHPATRSQPERPVRTLALSIQFRVCERWFISRRGETRSFRAGRKAAMDIQGEAICGVIGLRAITPSELNPAGC